jgi:serine/threonine-protein kinase
VAERGFDDDRPTVDLGPRPPTDPGAPSIANPFGDEPATEFDDPDDDSPVTSAEPPAPLPDVDRVHVLPTQQLPAPRARIPSSSLTRSHASATTTSPIEAMRFDEIARTRVFLYAALGICFGGIVVALATAGDAAARVVLLVGSIMAAGGAGWMLAILRDAGQYDQKKLVLPALPLIFGSMAGIYYWGCAGPVAAMLVWGIYFFSLGGNGRAVRGMYVLVACIHGALGLGIIFGVMRDHGVMSMQSLRTQDQIAVLVIVESLYFVAYLTARLSTRATLRAMSQLEQAVRGNAQRDALLAEARAELDRALKVGGPGRYTDQEIGGFRLGILIGRGGMGEVYEAHGLTDRREAAVKLLHPATLGEPTHVQRFLREAQTVAKLDTPHVVRVIGVGTTAGEIPYLAMERLRGSDLAHQLRRQRKLPLPAVKLFVEQVATGLEAARLSGVVHRDLKPHNVFLAEENALRRWKILDFGVSKIGGSGTLTKGHVVGTPAYMAPEQARGEDVDHRADVYSLSAIIFRAVTGHPAFTGKDVPATLYDVVYRVPTQPSLLAALPADVDRVLAVGLAKDPNDRFLFALELARWFASAIHEGLTPEQRRRADAIIAKYPWGTRPG